MSVTVSECPDEMHSFNEKSRHGNPEQKEELLGEGRPKLSDKLRHTAQGLEAIGFNENASMYQHGYRHFSIDSAERPPKDEVMAKEQNKRRMSFIKKFMGGKEKEGGGRGGEKA